jgi:hypothetical protein
MANDNVIVIQQGTASNAFGLLIIALLDFSQKKEAPFPTA